MNRLALLTQHGKAMAIAPALDRAGFEVFTVEGFDTDTLGTFTGETARRGSQLDAASAKAHMACELSGERYGLGSEGSFGPDPFAGISPWGVELLVWWDANEGRAIQAAAQGAITNYAQCRASSWQEALAFSLQVQFPSHGIIIGKPGEAQFSKNITDPMDFHARVNEGLERGPVWLETDMRAHHNPSRMAMIAQCAERLSALLLRACPECTRIGFGLESAIVGATCSLCRRPTQVMRAKRIQCGACGFSSTEPIRDTVPPSQCEHCNP